MIQPLARIVLLYLQMQVSDVAFDWQSFYDVAFYAQFVIVPRCNLFKTVPSLSKL